MASPDKPLSAPRLIDNQPDFDKLVTELKEESVLGLVCVTKTEVWDVENAEDGQPDRWTAISFEGESSRADEVAEAMGRAMKPEWYANFSTETHVYVIFEDRVFKYVKGDAAARAEAQAYATSAMGIDSSRNISEAMSMRLLVINWLMVIPKIARSRRLSW